MQRARAFLPASPRFPASLREARRSARLRRRRLLCRWDLFRDVEYRVSTAAAGWRPAPASPSCRPPAPRQRAALLCRLAVPCAACAGRALAGRLLERLGWRCRCAVRALLCSSCSARACLHGPRPAALPRHVLSLPVMPRAGRERHHHHATAERRAAAAERERDAAGQRYNGWGSAGVRMARQAGGLPAPLPALACVSCTAVSWWRNRPLLHLTGSCCSRAGYPLTCVAPLRRHAGMTRFTQAAVQRLVARGFWNASWTDPVLVKQEVGLGWLEGPAPLLVRAPVRPPPCAALLAHILGHAERAASSRPAPARASRAPRWAAPALLGLSFPVVNELLAAPLTSLLRPPLPAAAGRSPTESPLCWPCRTASPTCSRA